MNGLPLEITWLEHSMIRCKGKERICYDISKLLTAQYTHLHLPACYHRAVDCYLKGL